MSKPNRQARLSFAKMYVRQPTESWENVIFVDESKYNIFGSDGKQTVWRKSNTATHVKNLRPTVKFGEGDPEWNFSTDIQYNCLYKPSSCSPKKPALCNGYRSTYASSALSMLVNFQRRPESLQLSNSFTLTIADAIARRKVTHHPVKVSSMVSLTEINRSQDEMKYITRMRNAFEFRTASSKDYSFLNSSFQHIILCSSRRKHVLETCLRHTLSKVVNSHVLLHNYAPFAQLTLINGEDQFQIEGNLGQPITFVQQDDDYKKTGSFLIASLKFQPKFSFDIGWSHWNTLQIQFLMVTELSSLQENNAEDLKSMHAS
ncbi:transposable element Tcb1 transposase [Trichonephila clavipes]|uniref:Transposable element Tcb1 transposase n=1 Tax=Trichonephila clavipes TaxID=2585209 RepID=A0A8X6RLJ5_TRICX|nr:transposable element Tcb1 transposase [Trichonephila clavipes]